LKTLPPQEQPPAQAPLPPLEVANVVDPPLPPVTDASKSAPPQPDDAAPAADSPQPSGSGARATLANCGLSVVAILVLAMLLHSN